LILLDEAGSESFEHKINELHSEKILMGGEYCDITVYLGYFVNSDGLTIMGQDTQGTCLSFLMSVVTEPQSLSGWKGPQEVSCSTCCSK